jgi:ketosteroid isomerase-like protein
MRAMRIRRAICAAVAIFALGCGTANRAAAIGEINRALDAWHVSASKADRAGYIGFMAEDGVFMGTDASERWTAAEFDEFVALYFDKGVGWTYVPQDRHVVLSDDGRTAWFDERLISEKYGELRGTGVLRLRDGAWKLVHYSMTFPLPNAITKEVVEMIRTRELPDAGPPATD